MPMTPHSPKPRGHRLPARALPLLVAVLLTSAAHPAAAAAQSGDDATVVYLVRHAERADDDPTDPTLTPGGRARAEELARVLSDAGVTAIWSTPFRRTQATVAPLAGATGLEVGRYDPRDPASMESFVEALRSTPGRLVVSGHSNTTPALVRALGGDPVSDISEDEYDRLYVVVLGRDGSVTSMLLRYGAPSGGG